MRLLVLLAALALVAGCGEEEAEQSAAAPPQPLAELKVTVDDGSGPPKSTDVRCADGSESAVCGAVADLKPKTLAPTPGNVACTQQYGGPETARVTGTLRGEPVDARFSRVNGCEIARWDAARALLETVG